MEAPNYPGVAQDLRPAAPLDGDHGAAEPNDIIQQAYLGTEDGRVNIFLAGTITGSEVNWQEQAASFIIRHAGSTPVRVFNPRRGFFEFSNSELRTQIEWEYQHMLVSDAMLFWFGPETVAPITLFELGKFTARLTPDVIAIGAHPDYPRRSDLEIQLGLMGFNSISSDLEATCTELLDKVSKIRI